MYLKFKDNTDEIKMGLSLMDEDGFITPLFFTKDVWKTIIEAVGEHIESEDNHYDLGYNAGYQKALADAKTIIMQTKKGFQF